MTSILIGIEPSSVPLEPLHSGAIFSVANNISQIWQIILFNANCLSFYRPLAFMVHKFI